MSLTGPRNRENRADAAAVILRGGYERMGQLPLSLEDLTNLARRCVRAEEALRQLRDAWNAHMARCRAPIIPGMTDEELFRKVEEWQRAKSDTASADIPEEKLKDKTP